MRLIPALLCLIATSTAQARPTVGLVLGGGGARGAAHIGVLEVLEELRVPVDCIAGTSMGALTAGSYAAGLSPRMMRDALGKADWTDMFIDNPDYSELSYRNKIVSRQFLPGSETGVGVKGMRYQRGMVSGQKIKLFFNQLVGADIGERKIEELPLPLSIIATDIGTGDRVVFRDGNLTHAMRASMSVPGLLAPVDFNGRRLVDGGLVDNLPIEEARQRCRPDVIIAVNVGSPLLAPDEIDSMIAVSAQMVNILTEQNVSRSLAGLKPEDIYIKPDLDGIAADDFQLNGEAAERGRAAAAALRERLLPLSVGADEYGRWQARIAVARRPTPSVDAIEIAGLEKVNPVALTRHLRQRPGNQVDATTLNQDLLRVYGDGYYEGIDYELVSVQHRNILRILPVEKPWGPDYVRLGGYMESSLQNGSAYAIRFAYHSTWLNRLGGEFLASGEIGSSDGLTLDWYQPIDDEQRYFVEPRYSLGFRSIDYFQDDRKIARFSDANSRLGLMVGANIGRLGQFRFGPERARHRAEVDIGDPLQPTVDKAYIGWRADLDLDRGDRMFNSTRGWAWRSSWFDSVQAGYSKLETDYRIARSLGDFVLTGRFRYTGSPRGELPYYDAGALGGFLNMTGLALNQIIGDDVRYGGLQAERIIGRLPLGLRGDMRLGFALETGRVGRRYTETARGGWLNSFAVYVGGETPIGQVNLSLGRASTGTTNIYLSIGTP